MIIDFDHCTGDCGRSNKPARVVLVATHPDAPSVSCRKNVVGEYASQDADRLVGKILSEFGNVFNIHAHAFIIDANAAANSPSMKAFKAALSDFKTEIIDVSIQSWHKQMIPYFVNSNLKFK